MKKEEILKKAQEENVDEMERYVYDKSMYLIFIAMFICLSIFSFTRFADGLRIEDYVATLDISISAGGFYRYSKTKKMNWLIVGICFLISGIVFAGIYFANYFGV